jgi:hypothetical protein
VYPEGKEKDVIYKIDGQWTDSFQIREGGKSKTVLDTFDHKTIKTTPLTVAPIEQQDDFETRRAWKKVSDAIVKGDMDKTSAEKTIIETRQREMRKQEKDSGREWERTFFTRSANPALVQRLAAKIGEPVNDTLTNGVWAFDADKASKAKSPFHPDVNPPIYMSK